MSAEKKPFITEKIVKKSGAGKTFRRITRIVAGGVLFGVIAVVTSILVMPLAQKYFGKGEEQTTPEMVVIPRDEPMTTPVPQTLPPPPETSPVAVETAPAESGEVPEESVGESENTGEESVTETVETSESRTDDSAYSMEDMAYLWDNVSVLCDAADASVVTVRTVESDMDIFDNPIIREGDFSGIVIAETSLDMKILTVAQAAQGDAVQVIWSNNTSQPARVSMTDAVTGLAILTIRKSEMDDSLRQSVKPIPLGNSNEVKRGNLLIGMGSPKGIIHSTAYLWASYIAGESVTPDGYAQLIFTDSVCESDKGTWFLNNAGELIGWGIQNSVLASYETNDKYAVVGISAYKGILEHMVNGRDTAFIGLEPIGIPASVGNDIPVGIYVKTVLNNSPAYVSGIQPGDIITKVDNIPITGLYSYKTAIEAKEINVPVTMTVMRESRDGYKEIIYTVTTDKREK